MEKKEDGWLVESILGKTVGGRWERRKKDSVPETGPKQERAHNLVSRTGLLRTKEVQRRYKLMGRKAACLKGNSLDTSGLEQPFFQVCI